MPSVLLGNITRVSADAIVNAASEWLLGGGGVDGAIHAAAGPQLLEACRALPELSRGVRCPVGEARITPGFKLPAQFVIHTVGPRWHGGRSHEPELLARCYRSCLELAVAHGVRSIAFPAISTGVFGYPMAAASDIAATECVSFFARSAELESIVLVAFSQHDEAVLQAAVATRAGHPHVEGHLRRRTVLTPAKKRRLLKP